MGVYLYCFTPEGRGPGADLAGVHGEPVSSVQLLGLTLWVGRLDAPPGVRLEAVRRHHAVVCAAWRSAPACLPARFGQWFKAVAVLDEELRERLAGLERALDRVAGAGEHGITILESTHGEDEAGSRPSTGRAYLESVREKMRRGEERRRRAEILGQEIEEALGDVIRAQRLDPLPRAAGLARVSHLVPAGEEAPYGRRLLELRQRHPEFAFLATGPWPPYSFVP